MAGSVLDPYVSTIRLWLSEGKNNPEIVELLGEAFAVTTTESSIRRLIERNESLQGVYEDRNLKQAIKQEEEAPGIRFTGEGDNAEVTMPMVGQWEDVSQLYIERVMERHQLDSEVWEAERVLPNVWQGQRKGGEIVNYYQFKLFFKKKTPIKTIFPAEIEFSLPDPPERDYTSPELGVIVTDHQAPHIDEVLHELFLGWLAANEPTFGVVGGDLLDNGYIGRHRDDPQWDATTQECIDSAGQILYDYRQASMDTEWSLIKGNHDDRIRNEQLERNERLYGVKPWDFPGEEGQEYVYSYNHLLHLRKLGVKYIEPLGTYEFQQVPITDLLSVRHGHKVVAGGALKTAVELGHSVILGHTHRQSVARKTLWNSITMQWHSITAIEAGCMCRIPGGLGFANGGCPDWQPGFATVTRFPDGQFTFDLATYEQAGILRWRDQVFTI